MKNLLKKIKAILDRNIDYGGAIIGATLLGGIVFWLNHSHGITPALTAALKQSTYTFFVAGFIVKNNERLAIKWPSPFSLILSTIVSCALATGLTFLVHNLKGTPEPLLSTLPTALMGPPGFFILGWRARRKFTQLSIPSKQSLL